MSEDEPSQPVEPEKASPEGPSSDFPAMPSLGGGLPGLGELFGQARDQLEQASHVAADVSVTGRAGGGAVEIELTGNLEVVAVHIAPEVVDATDLSLLEDLITAALRDALSEALEIRETAASSLLPAGFDIGSMVSSLFGAQPGGVPSAMPDLSGLDFGELMGEIFGTSDDDDDDDDEEEEDEDGAEPPNPGGGST